MGVLRGCLLIIVAFVLPNNSNGDDPRVLPFAPGLVASWNFENVADVTGLADGFLQRGARLIDGELHLAGHAGFAARLPMSLTEFSVEMWTRGEGATFMLLDGAADRIEKAWHAVHCQSVLNRVANR